MRTHHATILVALLATAPALAQEASDEMQTGETIQDLASGEEMAAVRESIGRTGREAEVIERQSDELFEVDDATSEIGQYDIELDGDHDIVSMTADG